jgi:hypothetical protein
LPEGSDPIRGEVPCVRYVQVVDLSEEEKSELFKELMKEKERALTNTLTSWENCYESFATL